MPGYVTNQTFVYDTDNIYYLIMTEAVESTTTKTEQLHEFWTVYPWFWSGCATIYSKIGKYNKYKRNIEFNKTRLLYIVNINNLIKIFFYFKSSEFSFCSASLASGFDIRR